MHKTGLPMSEETVQRYILGRFRLRWTEYVCIYWKQWNMLERKRNVLQFSVQKGKQYNWVIEKSNPVLTLASTKKWPGKQKCFPFVHAKEGNFWVAQPHLIVLYNGKMRRFNLCDILYSITG